MMLYPRRLLIAVGLAAFLGSLVAYAPLHLLARLLPEASPFRQAAFTGTLADGQLVHHVRGERMTWSFQWQPHHLLILGLGGQWQLETAGMSARGRLLARPWGWRVTVVTADLALERLLTVVGTRGVETDSPLRLRDVSVWGRPGSGVRGGSGSLSWGPDDVRLSGRVQPVAVPELVGSLSTTEERVDLKVGAVTAPDLPLMTANFSLPEQSLHVVVLGRAMRQLGLATRYEDEKAAFELRQAFAGAPAGG